jgi:heparan-alpha-glucosaminide N-acetyltransferase
MVPRQGPVVLGGAGRYTATMSGRPAWPWAVVSLERGLSPSGQVRAGQPPTGRIGLVNSNLGRAMNTSGPPGSARLVSLDAYRGAIMLLMASGGLGLAQATRGLDPGSPWRWVGGQVEHAEWAGFTLWDFIQPAFMFMVGVALPWSLASRRTRGQGFGVMLAHALWRSLALVLLAVFLTSAWSPRTDWVFTNVLAQIGLGYPFLFLLAFTRPRTQWLAAAGILVASWLAFALYPLPPSDFDWGRVGVPAHWPRLTGFAAHWEKNANFAAAFDQWFLNLFPRSSPFVFSEGGYQTLNFVPSLATMIFGMQAGRLLRGDLTPGAKAGRLVTFGLVGIVLGQAMAAAGICPIVKRIWTPSWAIFSAGVVSVGLAVFSAIIDWRGRKRWSFPLVVAGMNSIALYCLWQLMGGFIKENVRRHLGRDIFESLGPDYTTMLERGTVLVVLWLILLWMYHRRLFLRI